MGGTEIRFHAALAATRVARVMRRVCRGTIDRRLISWSHGGPLVTFSGQLGQHWAVVARGSYPRDVGHAAVVHGETRGGEHSVHPPAWSRRGEGVPAAGRGCHVAVPEVLGKCPPHRAGWFLVDVTGQHGKSSVITACRLHPSETGPPESRDAGGSSPFGYRDRAVQLPLLGLRFHAETRCKTDEEARTEQGHQSDQPLHFVVSRVPYPAYAARQGLPLGQGCWRAGLTACAMRASARMPFCVTGRLPLSQTAR